MGSASFSYTGAWQTFAVPTGVTSITVSAYGGAASGETNAGRVVGTITVADTDTLYIVVGAKGNPGVTGGSGTGTNAGGGGTFGGGGAGGDGYNANGGDSGGGYTGIRMNSTSGTIKCIAAGGGGDSGDGGVGGAGGTNTGASGGRGNAGSGSTTAATGGSQSGPGAGGTSSSGTSFHGTAGTASVTGRGGYGGSTGGFNGPGGGGGGGGYYPGGGGCGGSSGYAPGGGGGGGSNYVGGMASVTYNDRNGGTGRGSLTLSWTDPDQPPATPTITTPNGYGVRSLSTGSYGVAATVGAPPLGSTSVRALFQYTTDGTWNTYNYVFSTYRTTAGTCTATLSGLSTDNIYYIRCYAQGDSGLYSTSYDTASFYTDYSPSTPTSVSPANGTSTMSTGTQAVSAVVSDPDGGTVRALFRVSTDNFTTYTDTYSSYVTSGTTASATLTGLATDTQYSMRVFGQDPQGLFSASYAPVSFWTNRTPTAPTGLAPNNTSIDSTISQTFRWTFNDPDAGDTQSAAVLEYSTDNWTTKTTINITGATSSYTFAANALPTGVPVLWHVTTTDAGGLTGPASADATFFASPPAVNMKAQAGLSIAAVDTISQTNAMSAKGSLTIAASQTESPTIPMAATASMSITPVKTISLTLPISAQAGMAINSTHTIPTTAPMGAVVSLAIGGTKSIPGSIAMGATAGLLFQSVSGDMLIQATAGMQIGIPGVGRADPPTGIEVDHFGTVAMGATAGMTVNPDPIVQDHPVAMSATAGMSIAGVVTTQAIIGMAARASVSNSPGLSHIVPMQMSVRAQMSVAAQPTHPGVLAMAARFGMAVSGFNNHPETLPLSARASMTIGGHDTIDSGGLAIAANAGMTVTGHRSFTGTVAMGASAGIVFHQTQYTFDPPYLVATDSHGDTLTFTRNSSPVPSKVTNKLTVTNTGNVTP